MNSKPIIIKRYGNRHTARCGSVVLTTVLITALLAPLNAASFSRSKGSSGCRDCGECSCEPGAARVVAVKIYNQTRITEANLDRIIDVTNRVWSRYGINVRKSTSTDAVAVIVAGLASTFATDFRPVVLGDTLFTGGHATPYVHLWLANAEALAEEAEIEGQPFTSRPRNERDAILFQMLGVALAHELGHYLLDTAKHSSGGLLRENLTVRELVHPDPDHFRLTHEQQRLICRE